MPGRHTLQPVIESTQHIHRRYVDIFINVMYQYIALGRYTQHVYVDVSGRYSRNCVNFLPGCTDKLPQAFTKQRVCIGTDQEQHSILFSLAEELHTALFRLKA